MDDMLEFVNFVRDHEDDEEEARRRLPKRYVRDMEDPFQKYRDREFKLRFRFEKDTVRNVLYPLVQHMEKFSNRGLPIPVMLKLLTALRFYATGLFQRDVGDIHGIGQTSVSNIIKDISVAFASLLRQYVKLPQRQAIQGLQQQFYGIAGFPGVIGCVDGTHIKIQSPGGNFPEVYRNRKTFFSINVQVLVGPSLEILDLVVRYPGSYHDARIFRESGLGLPFEQGQVQGVMLGDSAYPCLPYLLTPVANVRTPAEQRYNRAHISTRNTVERAIGVWKRRFQCLHGLSTKEDTTIAIICATGVLHNLGRIANDADPEEDPGVEEVDEPPFNQNEEPGLQARANFIEIHF